MPRIKTRFSTMSTQYAALNLNPNLNLNPKFGIPTQILALSDHSQFRGAYAPSRVAVGAPADCFRSFNRKWRRCNDVVGGGADHHTRGAYAPQTAAVPSLSEDLGENSTLAN
jgi:hypothetical protein